MINIVIALPKIEEAKGIRAILGKHGFSVAAVCTTGAQVLNSIDGWDGGIVISGYKLTDMMYSQLHECLPDGFDMLIMASQHVMDECLGQNIVRLSMPLKVHDLVDTVSMMNQTLMRRQRRAKQKPKGRDDTEISLIKDAKELLMMRNHMSEEEAHRYLQKCSMDSSTNMVETAQMVLSMMRG